MIVEFIDAHREEFGVEPICGVLQIAPSTYYTTKTRPLSARAVRDVAMTAIMLSVFAANYSVYGARKLTKAMRRAGHQIGRDQTARLMRQAGIRGVRRGRRVFTTRPDPGASRSPDLVKRVFTADRPNALWILDLTYVSTWQGIGTRLFHRRRVLPDDRGMAGSRRSLAEERLRGPEIRRVPA